MFMLLYALVLLVGLTMFFVGAGFSTTDPLSGLSWAGIALMGLWWLATFVPCMSLSVRRLHDRDWSGAIYLIFFAGWFVPVIGAFTFIGYFVVMLLPGTSGENRYGPDPRGGDSLVEVFA